MPFLVLDSNVTFDNVARDLHVLDFGFSEIPVLFPSKARYAVTQIGVLASIQESGFDLARSYVAFHHSF